MKFAEMIGTFCFQGEVITMTTLTQTHKKPLLSESTEMKLIKLGILIPLFFSALIAYNLVKWTVIGFMFLIR
jgi:hypothetical protein